VSAGIYGGTGNTVSVTVDSQGRITAAANVASAGVSAATPTALGTVYGITPAGTAAVALGYQAAATTTSAVGTTAIGYQALNVNSATHNTAVGHQALVSNTTGSENMAFGTSALGGVTTGSENIGIGRGAGASAVSSNRNIFIGDDAGYLMSGNNNTILGRFTGNQGGLNILSASNYIVLSDGDGNPLISTSNTRSVALSGAVPQTGTGITFPATQSASSDVNTLDDYEEGNWTPTLTASTAPSSVNNNTRLGRYTKIGRQVTVSGAIQVNSVTGGSGSFYISGLPFTVFSSDVHFNGGLFLGAVGWGASRTSVLVDTGANETNIYVYALGSGLTPTGIALSEIANTDDYMNFNLTYFTT
jgi:hypothetical protein